MIKTSIILYLGYGALWLWVAHYLDKYHFPFTAETAIPVISALVLGLIMGGVLVVKSFDRS